MDGTNSNNVCPVCTLYLRPGMTMEAHLTTHPKQKVIDALIKACQIGQQNLEKISAPCEPATTEMAIYQPMNVNPSIGQLPANQHSFISYQQFMTSTGTSPVLNAMNPQFVAVPTVFNPQMICSPYIYQQQQQVQIVSAAANMQPMIPRQTAEIFPMSTNPAICPNISEISNLVTNSNNNSVQTKNEVITINNSQIMSTSEKSLKTEDVTIIESVCETNSQNILIVSNYNDPNENTDLHEEEVQTDTNDCSIAFEENKSEEEIETECVSFDDKSIQIDTKQTEDQANEIEDEILTDQIEECETVEENYWNIKQTDEELNKACQTTIDNEVLTDEKNNSITDEKKPYNEIENPDTVIEIKHVDIIESHAPNNRASLENNDNITFIEMDDINFILPTDLIQNGQSIISKVDDVECYNEANRGDRPQKLMIIGNEIVCKGSMHEDNENCMIDHYDIDDGMEVSQESLNIRADERMPPRGELSEQESNGASEVGWGTRIYQEGSSGMSTSYDLLARESWEASDYSDSEAAVLQSRIPPVNDNQDEDEDVDKKEIPLNFDCTTCGASFRCPKERRVHQTQEHTSKSPIKKRILKKRPITLLRPKIEDTKEETSDIDDPLSESKLAETKEENLNLEPKEENILCNICGELLPSLRDWTSHNRKMHKVRISNQTHTCKICQEIFPSEVKFSDHLKIHPLECHICGKNFYRGPNLRLHLKRHMGIKPYKCDVCAKAFLTKQKLREHHNIHTGLAPIKCSMCDETFRRHSNLVQHRNRHHLNIKKKVKDFVCHCGEIFHSTNKFKWHKEIHDLKPKSCKFCYEKFIHKASLTRHIRRAHNQRYVPEEARENENVECEICKGIYLRSSLDAHLYTHSGKKQHSCPICSKEFTTKWNLKLHKWTHAAPNSKPYRCELCQSAFIRQADYISHMNSHRKVRPYTCNYCGCKFIRKYNCLRHVREHEEGKSYKCTVCSKTFHRSYYLKEHMRVHSGIRPFSCHICGKASTTKSNHNKHMKIHHAREPVSTEG